MIPFRQQNLCGRTIFKISHRWLVTSKKVLLCSVFWYSFRRFQCLGLANCLLCRKFCFSRIVFGINNIRKSETKIIKTEVKTNPQKNRTSYLADKLIHKIRFSSINFNTYYIFSVNFTRKIYTKIISKIHISEPLGQRG